MTSDSTTLVFDGDQTLWDFRSALDRALAETRHELARITGVEITQIPSVTEMTTARNRLMTESAGMRLDDVRVRAFVQLLDQLGVTAAPELVDHVNQFFIGRRYEMCRPYRETVPVLRTLREHYRLVLLTNGNSFPERIGLGGLFEHTFFADDIGAEKPSSLAYDHVAAVCGGRVLVSIGDSIVNDIIGPASRGWRTIWVNRDSRELPENAHPDAILVSLEALATTLERILS